MRDGPVVQCAALVRQDSAETIFAESVSNAGGEALGEKG